MKGGDMMLNNVVLVGRVVEEPQLVTLETGYKVANLVVAVQRPFRNENNEYDVDFIPMQTWMGLAELVCEYVGKGSILGFRCRLATHTVEISETKLKSIDVVVERVSFIKLNPRTKEPINGEKTEEQVEFDAGEFNDLGEVKKAK